MMRMRSAWFVLVLGLLAGSAEALPITYTLTFTPSASNLTDVLSGTLTTDGTLGSIFAADILSWSFTQTGANPFTISGAPVSFNANLPYRGVSRPRRPPWNSTLRQM